MALPNEPLTRTEQYLNRTATGGGTIPDEPLTRVEMYLNKIATGDGDVPEVPLTRMEQYLAEIAENGGGGDGDRDVVRASWHQCPEAVQNYLANGTYNPSDYSTSQIANYAPAVAVASNTKPIGETVDGTTFYNQVPNEQTPFATANKAGTLEPLDRLRWINCPTVNNVRDLGGWACDGGTVKYGMLIRGGEPTAQDAAVLVDECGVKFEMNLRGRPEAERGYSILGNIGYAVFDTFAWYSIADTTLWRQMMRAVFNAVNNSIPVYFHCAAGLDRTGTMACILEALLGMSQSDCDKDYELSCFSTGTDTDQHARRRDETDWRGLIDQINAKQGSTFRDKVVNFVLSLGISIDDINKFRAVMIDGTPEILVSTTYTVTNTLTNVTNSNPATSAEEYQQYVASLTPSDEYVIDSVRVTMGGADITSQVFSGTETVRRFAVAANLSNCTSDAPKAATEGAALTIHLAADADYTMTGASVTVMMGGTNVSQYYSNGTITIPQVTGDIVITATAVPSALPYTNVIKTSLESASAGSGIYNTVGYKNDYRLNSSLAEKSNSGSFITGYIPVKAGDVVRFYGNIISGIDGGLNSGVYDDSGSLLHPFTPYSWANQTATVSSWFDNPNYDSVNNVLHSVTMKADGFLRLTLMGSFIDGTTVVTINEEMS